MGLKELNDYTYWRTKSPGQILVEVSSVGGWKSVFTDELPPRWAHKVRNYFNREPRFFMRLAVKLDKRNLIDFRNLVDIKEKGFSSAVGEMSALSGDVYKDELRRTWFQMDAGGAIYHFKEVKNKTLEAVLQSVQGQAMTPIFKLICPDGTGGSCETILKNFVGSANSEIGIMNIPGVYRIIEVLPGVGDSSGYRLGEINKPLPIEGLIKVIPSDYQGSYNFAETVVSGLKNHTKFDINPHEKDDKYMKVNDRFSDLFSRIFPEYDDKGNLLADLKWLI